MRPEHPNFAFTGSCDQIRQKIGPTTPRSGCNHFADSMKKGIVLNLDRKRPPGLAMRAVGALLAAFVLTLSIARSSTQSMGSPPAAAQQGGISTGGSHAPVYDKEKRPITAGGFVEQGPVVFQDVSQLAGLTTWRHTVGHPGSGADRTAPRPPTHVTKRIGTNLACRGLRWRGLQGGMTTGSRTTRFSATACC